MRITSRQSFILRKLVEGHQELANPVGSKWLADRDDVPWGPSTVRAELARLEEFGLLEHPHTSAGRVPTDTGYRHYVDELLVEDNLPAPRKPLELTAMQREVEDAMRATTEQLSQVTNLLALVSAPPIETAVIHRVEVLRLQPQVAMVVVITSTGGVTKRIISYDSPLDTGDLPAVRTPLELNDMRREVDEAMRATTEQLSQVTDLLALVSAPAIGTATIHRVELLLLQPQVAMVVVITSTGGVTKRVVSYDEPLDAGLVAWAGSYLNEVLGDMDVGARMLVGKLTDPGLDAREAAFLATLAPAFTELEESAGDNLFVEGAARLFSEQRFQDLPQLSSLMDVLERRVALLGVLRASLTESNVYLRIGSENPAPELRSLSMVAANYGLARRNLGAVSVIGPVSMDYPRTIIAVRQAAAELSRFVGQVYDE